MRPEMVENIWRRVKNWKPRAAGPRGRFSLTWGSLNSGYDVV
jgi:hypothetical protein